MKYLIFDELSFQINNMLLKTKLFLNKHNKKLTDIFWVTILLLIVIDATWITSILLSEKNKIYNAGSEAVLICNEAIIINESATRSIEDMQTEFEYLMLKRAMFCHTNTKAQE